MPEGEKVAGVVITKEYQGNILFCFENGKIAKIDIKGYETKQNRKKLTNAYSLASKLVKILYLKEDTELVAISNTGKALIFDSSQIALKTTKNSQGVNVMLPTKGSVLENVCLISETGIKDVKHYRTKNIPAKGAVIRPEDAESPQLTIFE